MKKIPKKLHLYWDGSPMSMLQTFTVTSFHKYNPDWKINIYMPPKRYEGSMHFSFIPDYTGKDYFHLIKNLDYVNIVKINLDDYEIRKDLHDILRSDIFRYHILYQEGGVWSDFDVLWLKPIEHFRSIDYHGDSPISDVDAIVSFLNGDHGGHSIGIMIHRQYDEYAKALTEYVKEIKPPFTHEKFGGSMLNIYYPNLASLSKHGNIIGARFETYYPYNIHPPKKTISILYNGVDLSCINNNVICLHWYNGHMLSKGYINSGGLKRECSMTVLLRKEGFI